MAFEIKQTLSELENEKLSLTSRILGPGRVVRMAERLRETNQQIPELNFCAISGEEMIGGIAYWPIQIGATPALLLGPLVVNPEWQGKGVGRGLIATTLGVAEKLGH
ncbi:MAG: GNAT family N-acetyltransferase, partial [Pseudomonadota bacterium]|nr:GNAT family N-acetyltransferase [Pseudomonadota bacterium]